MEFINSNQSEQKLEELKKRIDQLPKGNLTAKNIRGKIRMYLQWREDGKQKSRYIKASEEAAIERLIEERKKLEIDYQMMVNGVSTTIETTAKTFSFYTNVLTGKQLEQAIKPVLGFEERECMEGLNRYLFHDFYGKVCLLYGLRRTGKTTMLFQAISKLQLEKVAYIKVMRQDSLEELNKDLKLLFDLGIRYVFIDEVTLLEDFIDSASLFSDVYAMMGMKLILSGTDSLGFAISEQEELYDRTIMIHTTFIPFREYVRLLHIEDIDEYIRYGGTFRMGETDFDSKLLADETISFRDDESTRRYIDTAIARNIQHSLKCYEDGGHFRHLLDLQEAGELTGAINRIIEDMNHRFLVSVLVRRFKSHDLGSAAQIERKNAVLEGRTSILDEIDKEAVTKRLMEILEIKNKEEQRVEIRPSHVAEIKEYLKLLELVMDIPYETITGGTSEHFSTKSLNADSVEHVVFTQPGMRYCQAQALVHAMMKDDIFRQYPARERKQILEKILEEVRGRMLEEIVLLETVKALPPHKKAFKLQFDVGEFDMVIVDEEQISCQIFEVKHTDQIHPNQYRHLSDEGKCSRIAFVYGDIVSKTVLYRGDEKVVDGIRYQNVVEYLKKL
ncbi:MAG: AAA family ATPase [Dorea sp.]|nr:AAA family ATPase [Dorea sp.]